MSERNKSLAHFKLQKAPLFASLPDKKSSGNLSIAAL
jgi:hypothetical protein